MVTNAINTLRTAGAKQVMENRWRCIIAPVALESDESLTKAQFARKRKAVCF